MSRRERLEQRRRERARALMLIPVKLLGALALTFVIFVILLLTVMFALAYWFPDVFDWLLSLEFRLG